MWTHVAPQIVSCGLCWPASREGAGADAGSHVGGLHVHEHELSHVSIEACHALLSQKEEWLP
jgi:hypothetical protein